jgi:excisionase family DNA binding protein
MEKRLFTVREIHLLVDELLRAIEYTSEEHVDDTDQKFQAGENEKLTLTVTEAAELIGVCKPTMYELVRSNSFRSLKVGKKILISNKSFTDWIRNGGIDAAETGKR